MLKGDEKSKRNSSFSLHNKLGVYLLFGSGVVLGYFSQIFFYHLEIRNLPAAGNYEPISLANSKGSKNPVLFDIMRVDSKTRWDHLGGAISPQTIFFKSQSVRTIPSYLTNQQITIANDHMESYVNLYHKMASLWKFLAHHTQADFYLVRDDDTFIYWDKVLQYLPDCSDKCLMGDVHQNLVSFSNVLLANNYVWPSGQAYILSRKVIECLAKATHGIHHVGDDKLIGKWSRAQGCIRTNLNRHFFYNYQNNNFKTDRNYFFDHVLVDEGDVKRHAELKENFKAIH